MADDQFPFPSAPRRSGSLPTPSERVWSGFLAFLAELPPGTRAAFLLHEVFNIDHAEIGRMLGATAEESRRQDVAARPHARALRAAGERRTP